MRLNSRSFVYFWAQLPNAGFWLSLLVFTVLVVASFLLFEGHIQDGILQLMQLPSQQPLQRFSLALVVVLLLALDVVLPVPSSMLALLAVALLGFTGGSAVIFIGLCCGAIFGYLLGAGYCRLASSWLSVGDQRRAGNLAGRLGTLALVCLRGVPVLAEISVLAAGIQGYPLRQFIIITTLANAGLAFAYGYIGSLLAGQDAFWLMVLASIMLPCLFLIFRSIFMRSQSFLQARKNAL